MGVTTHEIIIKEGSGIVMLKNPSENERKQVFQKFFTTLPTLPYKLYGARKQLLNAKLQTFKPMICDKNKDQSNSVNIDNVDNSEKIRSLRSGASHKNIPGIYLHMYRYYMFIYMYTYTDCVYGYIKTCM